MSQRQVATVFHSLMVTFIVLVGEYDPNLTVYRKSSWDLAGLLLAEEMLCYENSM